jgi:hypothetical protein
VMVPSWFERRCETPLIMNIMRPSPGMILLLQSVCRESQPCHLEGRPRCGGSNDA